MCKRVADKQRRQLWDAVTYKGQDLLALEPEERARAGLFMRGAVLQPVKTTPHEQSGQLVQPITGWAAGALAQPP